MGSFRRRSQRTAPRRSWNRMMHVSSPMNQSRQLHNDIASVPLRHWWSVRSVDTCGFGISIPMSPNQAPLRMQSYVLREENAAWTHYGIHLFATVIATSSSREVYRSELWYDRQLLAHPITGRTYAIDLTPGIHFFCYEVRHTLSFWLLYTQLSVTLQWSTQVLVVGLWPEFSPDISLWSLP